MRGYRVPALTAAVVAAISLTACVPEATQKTSDTLAPLALPVPTVAVVTTLPTSVVDTVASEPAVTLATIATTVPPATTPAPGTTTTTAPATAPNSTPGTYTVVSKDTLSGIGRKCAITSQAVADYNAWSDGIAHPIYPGTVVKLPCTPTGATGTSGATTGPTTTTTVKGSTSTTVTPGPGGLYTVVAGDYLAGIAAKTGTTVDGIVQVNGWPDGDKHLIVPGEQIKLPAKTK